VPLAGNILINHIVIQIFCSIKSTSSLFCAMIILASGSKPCSRATSAFVVFFFCKANKYLQALVYQKFDGFSFLNLGLMHFVLESI
jgi:hypothetical protein